MYYDVTVLLLGRGIVLVLRQVRLVSEQQEDFRGNRLLRHVLHRSLLRHSGTFATIDKNKVYILYLFYLN